MESTKRHTITVASRRKLIEATNGRCQYCGKQGILGYLYKGWGYYWKYLAVWEVILRPFSYWARERMQNPDGSNTWIIPFHFDHIIPVSKGGSNDETNLVLSCQHCNEFKGTRSLPLQLSIFQ